MQQERQKQLEKARAEIANNYALENEKRDRKIIYLNLETWAVKYPASSYPNAK